MKRYSSRILTAIFVLLTAVTPLALPVANVGAVDLYKACTGSSTTYVCSAKKDEIGPRVKSVINILLYVLATIAVIMIIVGGIRYSLSNGSAAEITGAKNTILYSVVGLVVAMLAWSIVNFVILRF
jgi:hypothetical protein